MSQISNTAIAVIGIDIGAKYSREQLFSASPPTPDITPRFSVPPDPRTG